MLHQNCRKTKKAHHRERISRNLALSRRFRVRCLYISKVQQRSSMSSSAAMQHVPLTPKCAHGALFVVRDANAENQFTTHTLTHKRVYIFCIAILSLLQTTTTATTITMLCALYTLTRYRMLYIEHKIESVCLWLCVYGHNTPFSGNGPSPIFNDRAALDVRRFCALLFMRLMYVL